MQTQRRRLTEGEITLARKIFQDSIDYSRVWLYQSCVYPFGIQDKNRAMARNNAISFPGITYSADFSTETDQMRQSVFIHEMTHVWQHQNHICHTIGSFFTEMIRHKFNYQACYFYTLDAKKDLVDYNFEQQAGIVQDYFLLKVHNNPASYKSRHRKDPACADPLPVYEKILERFLKNPFYGKAYKKQTRKNKGSGPKH